MCFTEELRHVQNQQSKGLCWFPLVRFRGLWMCVSPVTEEVVNGHAPNRMPVHYDCRKWFPFKLRSYFGKFVISFVEFTSVSACTH